MRLDRLRRRSGGVIDRRSPTRRGSAGSLGGFPNTGGGGGLGGRGGFSIGAIVLVVLVLLLASQCLGGGNGLIPDPGAINGFPNVGVSGDNTEVDPSDSTGQFVDAVADDVQTIWDDVFERAGKNYQPTAVVLFRGQTQTGCGLGSSQTGPFYCPADEKVYLDASFFALLDKRFGAPGDFAQAYVLAHEIGHHVQNLLGINDQVQQASQQDPSQANALSVRMELQADCLAGVWAQSANERGVLEAGDLEEGIQAAAAVGDDRIQSSVDGRIDPESWTHGSSEQRMRWLREGFDVGNIEACDTFSVSSADL